MCFRPSQADLSVICPNCGKKVSSLGGVLQTKCPFCNEDLTDAREATAADNLPIASADRATAMPEAPMAPAAPSVPAPPTGQAGPAKDRA